MNDRELFRQKRQAQLDEWKAELEKLRARASGASADAQIEMNKQLDALKNKIEDGKCKLAELAEASDEAWGAIKDGVESAWVSLSSAFSEAYDKFDK